MATTLRTRTPSGKPSWPLILLAGESKTGKTHAACAFTGDPRVGRAFVLDLGEGCADEYIVVPGADYEIIDHDGTWVDIIDQVEAVRDIARAELDAGRNPVVLVVDSMTTEWAMLTEWTNERAKRSKSNRALLAENPDAEIDVSSNYWNDANSRHNRLMNILKTFPGVVVLTTLETEKTQFGPGGRPLTNAPKVAKPDGQKRLPADVNVWIRLSLTEEPVVVGMRYPGKMSITPGRPGKENQPKPWPDFTLGKLVFDFLGIAAATTETRTMPALTADQALPEEQTPGQRKTTLDEHARARAGVNHVLAARDTDDAAKRMQWVVSLNEADLEIGRMVDDAGCEALGIHNGHHAGKPVTLLGLAELVVGYCERHTVGPRVEVAAPTLAATNGKAA